MAKANSSFTYVRRSPEDIKARANMRGGGFDSYTKPGYKRYKVRDGKNLIRLMPNTWQKSGHYGYDIWVNYGIGADNQSYLSLSKMDKEAELGKDPLAAARREAQREGDEETAKGLAPRQRILAWVIDRLDEEEGPQLWDIPFSVDKDFVNLCRDEDTRAVSYPDDPDEGNDLRFYKEGTGLNTKYPGGRMKLMDESPLHEDASIQKEWMDYIVENQVPDCLQFYDAEAISSAFDGQVRKPDDDAKPKRRTAVDDDDDDKPAPKSARKPAKPDPDEDPEDDEPEEKPKKPATRERVREADPEEVEPEEDEPEEKPKSSLRERLAARKKAASKSTDEDDE